VTTLANHASNLSGPYAAPDRAWRVMYAARLVAYQKYRLGAIRMLARYGDAVSAPASWHRQKATLTETLTHHGPFPSFQAWV
jgi:hypothetical protein